MQDWTYEDGEQGFDAVKKQRDDANATLERVREALKTTYPRDPVRALVEAALASISVPEMRSFPSGSVSETRSVPSQPEAPDVDCPGCGYSGKTWEHKCPARRTRFESRVEQTAELDVSVMATSAYPEAPSTSASKVVPSSQGPAAEADPDWQDVAQYSNECPQITELLLAYEQQRRDLAAANALINELGNYEAIAGRLQASLDAANATLERVRALAEEAQHPKYGPGGCGIYPKQLLAALARPGFEAPKGPAAEAEEPIETCCDNCETPIDGDKAATSDVCWDCWRKSQDDLAAANARIVELEARNHGLETDPSGIYKTAERVIEAETALVAEQQSHMRTHKMIHERLDAANARADAAEQENATNNAAATQYEADIKELRARADAAEAERCNAVLEWYEANARADAAERKERDLRDGNEFLSRTLGQVSADRDQLAQKLEAAERAREQDVLDLTSAAESWEEIAKAAEAKFEQAEQEWEHDRKLRRDSDAERDQLAARVTELTTDRDECEEDIKRHMRTIHNKDRVIAVLEANQCTPAERQVLEASDEVSTVDLEWCDTLDSECSEPIRIWARAELANRAAKAKQNRKG